ncbi:MAG: flagellar brake domain-containing protein [Lachnospiraceae bacterium]|nr:flagellar brake domain-containing protein [Lachnospiraceae bacterium]
MSDIKPGNKLSIRFYQEAARAEHDNKEEQVFASRVFDVLSDGTLELDIPTKEGKLVLLPHNVRYLFEFTTDQGVFRCAGQITERIRRGNFYLMRARIISKLQKYQRREYYRLNVMMDVMFQAMDSRVEEIEKMSEVRSLLQGQSFNEKVIGRGTIVDISGGGMRFISETHISGAEYMFVAFNLVIGGRKQMVEVLAKVIAINRVPDTKNFTYRLKFMYKDTKIQEKIIRYIFEEERRIRKKELG